MQWSKNKKIGEDGGREKKVNQVTDHLTPALTVTRNSITLKRIHYMYTTF